MNESRQPPTADQPNDDPGPVLVVLLHAYSLGPESLDGLRDRIRSLKGFETDAEAEIIVPALPLSLLSLVDPSASNFSKTQGTARAAAARSRMISGNGAITPCCPMRSPR